MIPIFDRIYYTTYRVILKIANLLAHESDLPRTRVVLILSIFSGISFIAMLGVLSKVMDHIIIIDSPIKTVISGGLIIALNFLLIFYRKRYQKIETTLSATWDKDKIKNIVLTLAYIVITILFVFISIQYVRNSN